MRVNGQPVSSLGSKDGVMVWDVELQNGANYIEARHGSIMDAARIEVGNVFTDRTMM